MFRRRTCSIVGNHNRFRRTCTVYQDYRTRKFQHARDTVTTAAACAALPACCAVAAASAASAVTTVTTSATRNKVYQEFRQHTRQQRVSGSTACTAGRTAATRNTCTCRATGSTTATTTGYASRNIKYCARFYF